MNIHPDQNHREHSLSGVYGDAFYEDQMGYSLRSGMHYAQALSSFHKPDSVIDIGCGRGTWLKAFGSIGASRLVGIDGPWNAQADMIDPAIIFHAADLNQPIDSSTYGRFDLAMSLETGEHLETGSSDTFVRSLTDASDMILFSAAYTGQDGPNHINEQPHTFWANRFIRSGYEPYDLFRPLFWGNPDIPFWYQQNVFLYVKKGSPNAQQMQSKGAAPLENVQFMDCIHPELYDRRTKPMGTKKLLKLLGKKMVSCLVRG